MEENKHRMAKSGIFDISPNHKLSGTLFLDGQDSLLHVWSDTQFNVDLSENKTITGVLDDQKKVSLIECITVGERWYHGEGGVSQHHKFFPHYIILGGRHFSYTGESISKVSLVIDDAAILFHDRFSFGTLTRDRDELVELLASNIDDETKIGYQPIIAYYTGKYEIFSVDTIIGKISSHNAPSFNSGGPEGVCIKNRIYVVMEFANPISVEEMTSRVHKVLRFFDIIVGRPQNLIETNIIDENEQVPQESSVHVNMYPKYVRLRNSLEPDFRDILIDAAWDPINFGNVLSAWLERDTRWGDARLRFSRGWKQNRNYDADRIIGAANMFDLLPKNEFPKDVSISSEIAKYIAESKEIFRAFPPSDERNSILNTLGKFGRYSLKQKIQYRSKILTSVIGSYIPEINTITDAAVNCRNLYVHGSGSKRDRNILPKFLSFLTDTLEFVFCTSDLTEMGWNIKEWCKKSKGYGHPFCCYLHSYKENLSRLKSAMGDTGESRP